MSLKTIGFRFTTKQIKVTAKSETEVTLRLSLKMIGYLNEEVNFPHKLLLTDRQVENLHKVFAINSSANIKLSKSQLFKIIQSGGSLGKLLGPLLKTGKPLMKNVLQLLA